MSTNFVSIYGDQPSSGYYFLHYTPMVDGYRHAYIDDKGHLRLTRRANHLADPKCPGCVEDRGPCPECGRSTHPSLPPCPHHPEHDAYEEQMKPVRAITDRVHRARTEAAE